MECFYRVSTKVLLADETLEEEDFVVLKNSKGEYELPGGGMEYGESIALSIEREIEEELEIKIKVDDENLTPVFFDAYKSRSHDIWVAFVLYRVFANNLEKFEKLTFEKIISDRQENYVPYLWNLAKRETSK
jgi:8-oxo-dGTP pyrophosphatase MutT (NUDIX family)